MSSSWSLTRLSLVPFRYAALLPTGAVREVRMSAEGMYAFVEVASEEIAVTCLELDKAEFLGMHCIGGGCSST